MGTPTRLRIAFVVEHCSKQGGHERVVAECAERLADEHEVHIFANTFRDLSSQNLFLHYVPMVPRPRVFMLASFVLANTFLLRKGTFDIIHSQGPNAIVQNVVTVHTTQRAKTAALVNSIGSPGFEQSLPQKVMGWAYYRLIEILEETAYSPHSKRPLIAVSSGVRQELVMHYNVSPDRVRVIPNAVDLAEFSPVNRTTWRERVRDQLGFEEADFILLFVGGDWKRKGLDLAVQALSLVKDSRVKLLVVGAGDRKHYGDLATEVGVSERVRFVGHQRVVFPYYAASDTFLFPSYYEAFSLATLEAMASGVPMLLTPVGGAEEAIVEGETGCLISRDVRDIAEKIERLASDRALTLRMGKQARIHAQRFSWDNVVKMLLDTYREAVQDT